MNSTCTIGVGGYSGSGKTTLIEKALPELKRRGLRIGVLKHVHHALRMDCRGKDTDRFYSSGADFVFAQGSTQGVATYRLQGHVPEDVLSQFPCGLDLIIIEGHKSSALMKVWLEQQKDRETASIKRAELVLYRDDPGYLNKFLDYIQAALEKSQVERDLKAGLLVGGKSLRMGTPKACLRLSGETLLERSFNALSRVASKTFLLGKSNPGGSLHVYDLLPDVTWAEGPMAGMLSAFRWAPDSAWIISAVDMPLMDERAWNWLLGQRRPGVWAVVPRIRKGSVTETAGACYEPMIFGYIESLAQKGISSLQAISDHPKVITPVVPESISDSWKNVNTPEEWKEVRRKARELRKP